MTSGQIADRDEIVAALDGLAEAFEVVAALSFDALTHPELLTVLDRMETVARRSPTVGHRIIARLQREASPVELGAKSLKAVLAQRLRISQRDAQRRLDEAGELGPRTALNGQALEPLLARTAGAQNAGAVGPEHVAIIRTFFDRLPSWVNAEVRELSEDTLVRIASEAGPDELRTSAHRLAVHIDQDGPEPDDAERARKRTIRLGPQQADGMSKLTGWVDPQWRTTWEPILAKLGAPGMGNPDDAEPRTHGTPTQEQIDADTRNTGQRIHDAFTAVGRSALSSGELGQHNGLPVTIIVSTTLQDLEAARGSAVSGGGSLLPMADLIRLASRAHHYLRIYDEHTGEDLYLARSRRLASPAQRLVLHSRDRGCTRPGCTVSGYDCQVHHVNGWAKDQGQTNIDEEVFACPGDNRMAELGWRVRIRRGVAEWIPPPALDNGQTRVNYYHHPERLLVDPETRADT